MDPRIKNESNTKLLNRVFGMNNIVFKDGEIKVWGMACQFQTMRTLVILYDILLKRYGRETLDIWYYVAKAQARQGALLMYGKFGLKKNRESADMALSHGELVGMGKPTYIKFDMENKHFIIKYENNPFTKEFVNFKGMQKEAVDSWLRGAVAGSHEVLCNEEEMVAIETSCMVNGKPECIIECRPASKWDKDDHLVKSQFPGPFKEFDEIKGTKNLIK